MKSFKENVLAVVKKIPKGKTMSYKQVAEKAGSPKSARVVGSIMANNDDTTVPYIISLPRSHCL